ncbi:DUF2752 domain-containing protein [Vulgatibacter sp.]|uniref:DUF2752 domain-containing protein n=1 Tax=Vulgatibacter sp. TaxID=1971226 RepID=UPI003569A943
MIAIEWTRRPDRPSRWDALAGAGAVAWIAAWLFPLLPAVQRLWPSCHFQRFTGWPCGTCGFTRAFVRAARLDLLGALSASPLATLAFYAWGLFSLAIGLSWLVPGLQLPVFRPHRLLTRWGPLALFSANWAWLSWQGGPR